MLHAYKCFQFFLQSFLSGQFATFIGTLIMLSCCLRAPTVLPAGEANHCKGVWAKCEFSLTLPCLFSWFPSLRCVHSNACVIKLCFFIHSSYIVVTVRLVYSLCGSLEKNWPMTCSSLMKSVITFSSFAIPSGSKVYFSVNARLRLLESFGVLRIVSVITLWCSHQWSPVLMAGGPIQVLERSRHSVCFFNVQWFIFMWEL